MEKLAAWKDVSFTNVNLNDKFWRPRLDRILKVTLRACLNQCERTGRIANFGKAAGLLEGDFEGIYYNDSDVYKVLEGAAYVLMYKRDPQLEAEIDQIIDWISAAQEEDGYLDTYFTLKEPERKWHDMEKHEMYCGGHLIEAAVAYYEATGKRRLLDTACKLADHYDAVFGPGKRHWVAGHEEIELALIKLYRTTGEERYRELALWLLEERGRGHGRGMIWDREEWGPEYCQDDVPVREIREVKGHAVRAMYLYTGMADAVRVSEDMSYFAALDRVWEHTVDRNMYITGGIGPSRHNEGFTHDYDLPNESAYCETCAAIAMVFWNHRMNLLTGDAKYADIVEREMYNGALAGISLSGDRFFYVNLLASKGEHHRVEWFDCSCCPTNLVRFIPSIGSYVYAHSDDGIIINQYMNCSTELTTSPENRVAVSQQTEYPWEGKTIITINPEKVEHFSLKLRIPGWCKSYRIRLNHSFVSAETTQLHQGYLVIDRTWMPGDMIELILDMPVETIRANLQVEANRGRLALQRGPLVYCLEQNDNPELQYDNFSICDNPKFYLQPMEGALSGIVGLAGTTSDEVRCTFIPYFAWDNREPGFMQVWVREAESKALYRF